MDYELMMNGNVKIGQHAPDFDAMTTYGNKKLSDYKGKWLVFFSHPGDFTPVCTTEMIAFTALFFWGTANCLTRIFPCLFLGSLNELIFIIISAIPCLCLNYYLLWRKDKYLKYFESFEQDSKKNKEWMLISVICCISILAFFIMSFYIIES